ncbi:hypothetical protein BD769DRAFT_1481249, partial [Suillus cothurnatus]
MRCRGRASISWTVTLTTLKHLTSVALTIRVGDALMNQYATIQVINRCWNTVTHGQSLYQLGIGSAWRLHSAGAICLSSNSGYSSAPH